MSAATRDEHWTEFAGAVAGLAGVPAEHVTTDTRLVDDLGLDSLALAELVVTLVADFGIESLAQDFDERNWAAVTVGALYDDWRASQSG
jgi:acyl carrier protein